MIPQERTLRRTLLAYNILLKFNLLESYKKFPFILSVSYLTKLKKSIQLTSSKEGIYLHIGKRLKMLRKSKKISQQETCHGIISPSHYSNIETGRFEASEETLLLLAERLSVPAAYLYRIDKEDQEIQSLLRQYEKLIEAGEAESLSNFYDQNIDKFTYISSVRQELFFYLLKCIDLFRSDRFSNFGRTYLAQVSLYVDEDILSTLDLAIQEKYFYVSGLYYYESGDFNKCIHHFANTLYLNSDPLLHARLTFNIALAHYQNYKYEEAQRYAYKAKDLYLNLHIWNKTADCYNLLGILYKEQKDLPAAENYIKKGLNILSDETEETYSKLLHNLALVSIEKQNYEKALGSINKSIQLKKEYGHGALFSSYRVKLNIYLDIEDVVSVTKWSVDARKACVTKLDEAHLQVIAAKSDYLLEWFSSYEELMEKSIKIYHDTKEWKSLKPLAEQLADYYAQKNQYKKAYELQQLCLLAIKSMNKELS